MYDTYSPTTTFNNNPLILSFLVLSVPPTAWFHFFFENDQASASTSQRKTISTSREVTTLNLAKNVTTVPTFAPVPSLPLVFCLTPSPFTLPPRSTPSLPFSLSTRSRSRSNTNNSTLATEDLPRSRTRSAPVVVPCPKRIRLSSKASLLLPVSGSFEHPSSPDDTHIPTVQLLPSSPRSQPLRTTSPFQPLTVMGVRAKVEQSVPNRPPTMGEGDVDVTMGLVHEVGKLPSTQEYSPPGHG
ncbi:hypothetical protein CCMSSC00406_0004841 [Pleurotus cornucopiae]|uniref:Uncharacterized protein n=1 Tax=Pleurotus cornucopiae TaxID=5321 RepID=A0ACB7J1M3_PLECO|nr:hypothetical protein CCMSSC00406_0004841 [Pleurotus cornucopiae]